MAGFDISFLTQNAFRTLGLRADATQEAVDSAARTLRLMGDTSTATPNDAPWLGPVRRTKSDVESAVARLAEPHSRIDERLWWFCGPPTASAAGAPAVAAQHDAALAAFYQQFSTGGHSLEQWSRLLKIFRQLAGSAEYQQWLVQVEAGADFEKRADAEEVSLGQRRFPDRLSGAMVHLMDGALAADDFNRALRIAGVLQWNPSNTDLPDPTIRIFDRLEDTIARDCGELRHMVHVGWGTRQVSAMRVACGRAHGAFNDTVLSRVKQFAELCPDVGRQDRVRGTGIAFLCYLAEASEAMRDYAGAKAILKQALDLAWGTPAVGVLQNKIDNMQEPIKVAPKKSRFKVYLPILFCVIFISRLLVPSITTPPPIADPDYHFDPALPDFNHLDFSKMSRAYKSLMDLQNATARASTSPSPTTFDPTGSQRDPEWAKPDPYRLGAPTSSTTDPHTSLTNDPLHQYKLPATFAPATQP